MRTHLNVALVAACLTFLSSLAFAATPLSPAGRGDQVPTRLVSVAVPAGEFEHAPVSFGWKLDPKATLQSPAPATALSREYWQTVDATELKRGIDISTTAPGTMIRVSPVHGAAALKASSLGVTRDAKAVRLEKSATMEQLRAVGMDVSDGTAVLKIGRENTPGHYALHATQAQGRYVVHVFEPESNVVLKAQADRSHVLGGGTIGLSLAMSRGNVAMDAKAEALLVAPDGRSTPVAVTRDASGKLSASVRVPTMASAAPGLWELQVFANADGISRDARTAFAVAAPTARFKGVAAFNARQLRLTVPVETASTGRYEASGTLFATAPDGALRPVSQAQSAAWFQPGSGSLVLAFDRAHVPAGYGAPFEVRQLQLQDQTRMAPLETRERGGRF
ncbi:DUF4785 domain-containing protein [Lysobacter fragariae]